MITVRLFGGLGNQMFQYAAARAVALRNKTDVETDISWYAALTNDTRRRYELADFNIHVRKEMALPVQRFFLYRLLSRFGLWSRYIHETTSRFDATVLQARDGTYLDGYWQSEKYFLDYADTIRKDFTLREPTRDGFNRIRDEIAQYRHSVSVHVRRGDYASDAKTNAFHGTCPPEYYQRAIDYLDGICGSPMYFVFSDDIEWTKTHIRFSDRMRFVSSGGLSDTEEMIAMSLCEHHIIANSSFSWWGAWLGENGEKIVIAPQKWFRTVTRDTLDLLPEAWIKM